jgi:two-component system CheB/CheR fusion protein
MQDITHPDDQQCDSALFDMLIGEGAAFQIEKRYLRPDGSAVWVHDSVSALVDHQGQRDRVLSIIPEKTWSDNGRNGQRSLLLGELDHRVKNILAVVSSVATQTLKTNSTPGAFVAAIEGRIAAIARAQARPTPLTGWPRPLPAFTTRIAPRPVRTEQIRIGGK